MEQKLKIQKSIPRKDRESDASTYKNEIETSTSDNDDDDDDYGKTIKKNKKL